MRQLATRLPKQSGKVLTNSRWLRSLITRLMSLLLPSTLEMVLSLSYERWLERHFTAIEIGFGERLNVFCHNMLTHTKREK